MRPTSAVILVSSFRVFVPKSGDPMSGKGNVRRSRSGRMLHGIMVCLTVTMVLATALTSPLCHCRCDDIPAAATGCCQSTLTATCCGCHCLTSTTVDVERSTPCVPCSCYHNSSPVYAESVASLRPIEPSTQYFRLPPRQRVTVVLSRQPKQRNAFRFETSSKLCSRLCRFLV